MQQTWAKAAASSRLSRKARALTGELLPEDDLVPLRGALAERVRAEHPDLPHDAMLSRRSLPSTAAG